jgi:hypothetical protein
LPAPKRLLAGSANIDKSNPLWIQLFVISARIELRLIVLRNGQTPGILLEMFRLQNFHGKRIQVIDLYGTPPFN